MMKKHWPILFTILMVILSVIFWIAAANSTDAGTAILAGVVTYMFLFPLAGAVIGGWYGWKIRTPLKWLLIPAVYLGVFVFMAAADLICGSERLDPGSYLYVGLFTGIACLAVEVITSFIAWLVRKSKEGVK